MYSPKHAEDELLESEDLLARVFKAFPPNLQDALAMYLVLFVLPIMFLIEIFYVIGETFAPFSGAWLIRAGFLCLLSANVFINYVRVITYGPNGKNPNLPSVVQPGYRFCHSCKMNAPPRAYHCPVCDKCAFRRDHHCSFTAVCIGHFNQRFFVAAILNLLVILTYFQLYNWEWLMEKMSGMTIAQAWELVLPHLALLFRAITVRQFFCILFHAYFCVAFLFTLYLVGAQVFCLARGQTRVEYLLDVHAYHLGFWENVRQALGTRWVVASLVPFVDSPLPSASGTSFIHRDIQQHSSPKSL